jgi:hypothetical protein
LAAKFVSQILASGASCPQDDIDEVVVYCDAACGSAFLVGTQRALRWYYAFAVLDMVCYGARERPLDTVLTCPSPILPYILYVLSREHLEMRLSYSRSAGTMNDNTIEALQRGHCVIETS